MNRGCRQRLGPDDCDGHLIARRETVHEDIHKLKPAAATIREVAIRGVLLRSEVAHSSDPHSATPPYERF
jgi:hypothetical protein